MVLIDDINKEIDLKNFFRGIKILSQFSENDTMFFIFYKNFYLSIFCEFKYRSYSLVVLFIFLVKTDLCTFFILYLLYSMKKLLDCEIFYSKVNMNESYFIVSCKK
jgi:hypothetical protein